MDVGGRPPVRGTGPLIDLSILPMRGSGWLLRGLSICFAPPLALNLVLGRFDAVLGCAAGIAFLWLAGLRMADAALQERALRDGRFDGALRPWRRIGIGLTAAAGFSLAFGGAGYELALSVVFAAATGLGAWLAYGDDPVVDTRAADRRAQAAGLQPAEVRDSLAEARGKIAAIDVASRGLANSELTARLGRIVGLAQAVLAHVEEEPGDLARARRFFVTYLDGTRDVVASYAAQERDLAGGPLTASFRTMLGTVEAGFAEQLDLLRRHEKLDLEVKIEVLETQLRHEGVH